jgi:flagellar protein FliL
MAEQANAAAAATPKKNSTLVFILIGVILLMAGGGAAWFLHSRAGGAQAAAAPKEEKKEPEFTLHLESFTVNLNDQEESHFLRVTMEIGLAHAPKSQGKEGGSVRLPHGAHPRHHPFRARGREG